MIPFATPVARQVTWPVSALIRVTPDFATTATSKATSRLTAPTTGHATTVARLATLPVTAPMTLSATSAMFQATWPASAPRLHRAWDSVWHQRLLVDPSVT
eukprot:TRINITY_DN154_c0_g1_i1.p2 TRINITY_DN154_c0_g1~~TRINITY_DN154_c0_g1_i1.p2  ORF type:complete len:101 (-),score=5.19 TRINITY_DN154_c0_g1_i1:415-717(-)